MKKIFYSFTLLCLSACLVSCEQQLRYDGASEGGLQPINFSTGSFDYSIVTRSDLSSLCSEGFGVIGYNTGEDDFASVAEPEKIIDNYRLTSTDGTKWEYAGAVAFWNTSSSDKYTFLAYHPYDQTMNTNSLAVPLGTTIDECVDYLVANPVVDQVTKNGVRLDFEHIFSKINVNLSLSREFDGQSYELKEISFRDVVEYPSYSLLSGFETGSTLTHDIVSGEGNIENPLLACNGNPTALDPIFISPYDYASNNKSFKVCFVFDYTFTDSKNVVTVNTLSKEILIGENLRKNKEYNLNVTFTPDEEGGIEFTVSLDDYTEKENMDFGLEQTDVTDLSAPGVANSYIVPQAGYYKFRGANMDGDIESIADVEVLWESYGTDETINPGDLICNATLAGDYILFNALERKGNALIAAKDAEGNVLWSWHLWLTDRPSDQIYENEAGTLMDRNLGATSALKQDGVRTYGLFYQWGRKDPFLGTSAVSGNEIAANTGTWPEAVQSTELLGTSDYADSHPMTFIKKSDRSPSYGWLYARDDERWNSSDGKKTVNDPCPFGYRVPQGSDDSPWALAAGMSGVLKEGLPSFDGGYDFGAGNGGTVHLTSETSCWYPAQGYLENNGGSLSNVGMSSCYWTQDAVNKAENRIYYGACMMMSGTYGQINISSSSDRASGYPVRCVRYL